MKQLFLMFLILITSSVNAQQQVVPLSCEDYVVALKQLEGQVLLGDQIMSGMRFHLRGIEREIDLQNDETKEPDEALLAQYRTLYNDLVHKYNEINRMRNDAYDKWQVIYNLYKQQCIIKPSPPPEQNTVNQT